MQFFHPLIKPVISVIFLCAAVLLEQLPIMASL